MSYELDFPSDVAEQLLACTRKDIVPDVLEQLERLARNPSLATRVESGALAENLRTRCESFARRLRAA